MTSRLPPDVDRLLWEVAESQDTNAYDDFESRFPHLVGELGQRIKLVREFRGARRETAPTGRAPRFDYQASSGPSPARPLVWASGFVILVVLGFGAFVVTKGVTRHATAPPSPQLVVKSPTPAVEPHVTPTQPNPTPPASGLASNAAPGNETSAYSGPKWNQKQTVKFPHERLQTVLAAIATQGGLNITFAPETPNPEIAMEYRGMTPVEIIQDLGRKFGFTAFKSGRIDVLIVPARDPNAKDAAPVEGEGIATDLDGQTSSPNKSSPVSSKGEPIRKPAKPPVGATGPL